MGYFILLGVLFVLGLIISFFELFKKNMYIWFPSYIKQCLRVKPKGDNPAPLHIIFCLVDHFEPKRGGVSTKKELEKVDTWIKEYSEIISRHKDSAGNPPRYSFFYPVDEFTPEVFEKLVDFCKQGFAEVELHLHHDNDTGASLTEKLNRATELYARYGVLSREKSSGKLRYGFIHGNWSLDNSRKDGRWCGVNNELQVLSATGCYADFTLPSAPSETQTRKINSIYYATDNPAQPKSHNTGIDVEAGKKQSGDLMLIQGPLALNWRRRKFGIIPKIENGQIALENPAIPNRVDLWVRQGIGVKGRPEWVFVKVHTHGAQDKNLTPEYFRNLDAMFAYLEKKYNDGEKSRLYYVTARQMYNIVKAAEAGEHGEPEKYRDYLIVPKSKQENESA